MLHKNQIEQATITAMSSDGNGIAKIDGMVVFVPYTAVGDQLQVRIVKVQKNFAFGIIDKWLQPSPDRVEDRCPVYKKCGGCAFRHISYDAELRHKAQFVEDNLRRIGGLEPKMLPITPSPLQQGYRHKCEVCGRTDADHPELEFRYCSKCQGYHCFCSDHIFNHEHFRE